MPTATVRKPPVLRSDADDARIWRDVYEDDEYGVVRADLAGKTVLDVGGHVGAFAAKCLDAGAARVVSVEPNNGTAAVYRAVLAEEIASGRCLLIQAAAWSFFGEGWLSHHRFPGARSGDTLVFKQHPVGEADPGEECRLVTLADLFAAHRPDVVKMDCEGAEYPLLVGDGAADLPPEVRLLWVEFHATGELDAWFKRALRRLASLGFEAWIVGRHPYDGLTYRFER